MDARRNVRLTAPSVHHLLLGKLFHIQKNSHHGNQIAVIEALQKMAAFLVHIILLPDKGRINKNPALISSIEMRVKYLNLSYSCNI